jgi:hypothetical protein
LLFQSPSRPKVSSGRSTTSAPAGSIEIKALTPKAGPSAPMPR